MVAVSHQLANGESPGLRRREQDLVTSLMAAALRNRRLGLALLRKHAEVAEGD